MQPDPAARLSPPAIALMITGALNIVATLGFMLIVGLVGVAALTDPDVREALPGVGVWMGVCVIGLILSALTIYAGWQMRSVQNWGVCMAGTIAAMLPCTACCILGLPIGIWAILVLMDDEVKQAFNGYPPPPPGGYEPPPGGYDPPTV